MIQLSGSQVKIGLVGKPNAGKSTLFSAICSTSAEIGAYPFTTIKPNVGASFIQMECPHVQFGKQCNPNFGTCDNGKRLIPVEIIDIPGLIEGASTGKGMGNEFLENIKEAIAIIQVYDASGHSSMDGTILEKSETDPVDELRAVREELISWVTGKLSDGWDRFSKRADLSGEPFEKSLLKKVSSIGLGQEDLRIISTLSDFREKLEDWDESDFRKFAEVLFTGLKTIVSVGNKVDLLSEGEIENLLERVPDTFLISAEYELTLSKALSNGYISSTDPPFEITHELTEKQRAGIDHISEFFSMKHITRTRELLTTIVLDVLNRIVVYPVYDETHWTDKEGNVLPDAFIMKSGSTALDLAYRIHTDIGEGFIRAIDARTKRTVGKSHELKNGDVIKIISKSK